MYISIERNARGALEISKSALNKLIKSTVLNVVSNNVKDIKVETDLYQDTIIYVLINVYFKDPKKIIEIDDKKINKAVEYIVNQTLDIKPRNIAIAYNK